jgi:putative DNA primase/helicase
LRTGISHDPDPTDYITRKAAYTAAPNGTPHPLWTAFLDRITAKNAELQSFLQRYCGYATTGITIEHKFVFAYGTGANSKSTFLNTIAAIFGDYATVADMGTFIATNNERHPTDLAKLRGARLVVAQETQKRPTLGRDQNQGTDRRRQDYRPLHAARLFRFRSDLQAVYCRQPQAAPANHR